MPLVHEEIRYAHAGGHDCGRIKPVVFMRKKDNLNRPGSGRLLVGLCLRACIRFVAAWMCRRRSMAQELLEKAALYSGTQESVAQDLHCAAIRALLSHPADKGRDFCACTFWLVVRNRLHFAWYLVRQSE
ncbi:hypothetical protein WDZ92_20515 [Nostoc sp. NIES-2111]